MSKNLFVASLLLVGAFQASANHSPFENEAMNLDTIVKFCSITHYLTKEPKNLDMVVVSKKSINKYGLRDLKIEMLEEDPLTGGTRSFSEPADTIEVSVRDGLKGTKEEIDNLNLNIGERVIAHAMWFSSNMQVRGKYAPLKFDLTKVSSVVLYGLHPEKTQDRFFIVEARGSDGQLLGSFFGGAYVRGSIVAPCEKEESATTESKDVEIAALGNQRYGQNQNSIHFSKKFGLNDKLIAGALFRRKFPQLATRVLKLVRLDYSTKDLPKYVIRQGSRASRLKQRFPKSTKSMVCKTQRCSIRAGLINLPFSKVTKVTFIYE